MGICFRVAHAFGMIKRIFDSIKVRYRGPAKNAKRVLAAAALANLFMARGHLRREVGA